MRTEEEIKKAIKSAEEFKDEQQAYYDKLDQYSMQGDEGYHVLASIHKIEEKIETLKWMLGPTHKVDEQKLNVAYFTEFGIRHSTMTLDELIPFSKKFKLCSAEYI